MGSLQSKRGDDEGETIGTTPLSYNQSIKSNSYIASYFQDPAVMDDVVKSLAALPTTSSFILIFPQTSTVVPTTTRFNKYQFSFYSIEHTIYSDMTLDFSNNQLSSPGSNFYLGDLVHTAEYAIDNTLAIKTIDSTLFTISQLSPFSATSVKWTTVHAKSYKESLNTSTLASDYFMVYFKPKTLAEAYKHIISISDRSNTAAIYDLSTLNDVSLKYIADNKNIDIKILKEKIYYTHGTSNGAIVTFGNITFGLDGSSANVNVTNNKWVYTNPLLGSVGTNYKLKSGDIYFELFLNIGPAQWTTSYNYDLVVAKLDQTQLKILAYILNGSGSKSYIFAIPNGSSLVLPSSFKTVAYETTLYVYKFAEERIKVSFSKGDLTEYDLSFNGTTFKTFQDYSNSIYNVVPLNGPTFKMSNVLFLKYEQISYVKPPNSISLMYAPNVKYGKIVSILSNLGENVFIFSTDKPGVIERKQVKSSALSNGYLYSLTSDPGVVAVEGTLFSIKYNTSKYTISFDVNKVGDLTILSKNQEGAQLTSNDIPYLNADGLNIYDSTANVRAIPINCAMFNFNKLRITNPSIENQYIIDSSSNNPNIYISIANLENKDAIDMARASMDEFYRGGGRNIACNFTNAPTFSKPTPDDLIGGDETTLQVLGKTIVSAKTATSDVINLNFNSVGTKDFEKIIRIDTNSIFENVPGTTLIIGDTPTITPWRGALFKGTLQTIFHVKGKLLEVVKFFKSVTLTREQDFFFIVELEDVSNVFLPEAINNGFNISQVNSKKMIMSSKKIVSFGSRYSILDNVIFSFDEMDEAIVFNNDEFRPGKHKIYIDNLAIGSSVISLKRCLLLDPIVQARVFGASKYFDNVLPLCVLENCEDMEIDSLLMSLEFVTSPLHIFIIIRQPNQPPFSSTVAGFQNIVEFRQILNVVILMKKFPGTSIVQSIINDDITKVLITAKTSYFKFGICTNKNRTLYVSSATQLERQYALDFIVNYKVGQEYSKTLKVLLNERTKVIKDFVDYRDFDASIFPVLNNHIINQNSTIIFLPNILKNITGEVALYRIGFDNFSYLEDAVLRLNNPYKGIILSYSHDFILPTQGESFSIMVDKKDIIFDTKKFLQITPKVIFYGDLEQNDGTTFKFVGSKLRFHITELDNIKMDTYDVRITSNNLFTASGVQITNIDETYGLGKFNVASMSAKTG